MNRVFSSLRPKATPGGSQAVLMAATGARMILGLALTILLGRRLSAEDFGVFGLVSAVFTLAHDLTDMGSGNVALRDMARAPSEERTLLERLFGFRLGLSAVATLACAALAVTTPSIPGRLLLAGSAAVLAFSYVGGYGAVFQRRQAQVAPALLSIASQIGALVLAAGLVAVRWGGAWAGLIVVAREAAVLAGTRWLGLRALGYAPRVRLSRAGLGPFLGPAVIVALATAAYHFLFQGGVFFVQALRPASELGAFTAALRPLGPVFIIPWILMLPVAPLVSWLAAEDHPEWRPQARGVIDEALGLGAVTAVACAALARPALKVLYGDRFIQGGASAVGALEWFSIPVGCSFLVAALSTLLLAEKKEGRLLVLSLVSLIAFLGLNPLLIARDGFTGSAEASAACVGLTTVGGLWLARPRTGAARASWGRSLICLAPAAALAASLRLVSAAPFVELVAGGLLSLAALGSVLALPGVRRHRADQARLGAAALRDATA